MWVSLRTPSIMPGVIGRLVLSTIYRRPRILRYDLDIGSWKISMCFRINVLSLPNTFINYAHVLSKGSLVGGNDNSIIFWIDEVQQKSLN